MSDENKVLEEDLDPVLDFKNLIKNVKKASPSLRWDEIEVKLLPDLDYTLFSQDATKELLEKLVEQTPGNISNLKKIIKAAEKELGSDIGTNVVQLIVSHIFSIYQSVKVGRPFTEPKR